MRGIITKNDSISSALIVEIRQLLVILSVLMRGQLTDSLCLCQRNNLQFVIGLKILCYHNNRASSRFTFTKQIFQIKDNHKLISYIDKGFYFTLRRQLFYFYNLLHEQYDVCSNFNVFPPTLNPKNASYDIWCGGKLVDTVVCCVVCKFVS